MLKCVISDLQLSYLWIKQFEFKALIDVFLQRMNASDVLIFQI